ncbi:hypothetical protein [Roseomonas indoligenes]|uniref:Uncharacterized protein n=1 Tax=Roseomonas indoligenes TaxID=2820811 RepID=A0A940MW52_9PROT|nr:hypothetical protein [Pararoseomonas indoligenes]MBP0491889.1 hypothetical protein [Pararoseomonas indoligenes]
MSIAGPIMVAFLMLGALLRYAQKRSLKRSSALDEFGGEDEEGAEAGESSLRRIHPDFMALLEQVALPRMAANPGWDRLDGAYGVPGQPIAQFAHGDGVYAINGESRMEALVAIHSWMLEHPDEDPLMIAPMRKGVGRLTIRPEVGWPNPKDIRVESV